MRDILSASHELNLTDERVVPQRAAPCPERRCRAALSPKQGEHWISPKPPPLLPFQNLVYEVGSRNMY